MKWVLSIDGGGIRGIIPAYFISKFEQWSKLNITDCFDLVAGTSTGGIIALKIVCPTDDNISVPVGEQLVDLYRKFGKDIFQNGAPPIVNYFRPKFGVRGIESVLRDHFGNTKLSEAVRPVLVTSYDIKFRRNRIFKSEKAREHSHQDCLMSEVARATSAAPTYFPPAIVHDRVLVDGGVFANNPALITLAEARRMWPEDEVVLVSIGTGEMKEPFPTDDTHKWGQIKWGQKLFDCVTDGSSDATDYTLKHLMGPGSYFRFQCTIPKPYTQLDDVRKDTIERLLIEAEQMLNRLRPDLAVLTNKIVEHRRN